MNSKNKKFSLAIDGSTNILSIAILDKIKIVKVKHYKLQNFFNFDDYFVNICDFLKKEYNFNSLYVGCGPGSFSGVRKTISFAKALKFSKGEKFSVIGINSLAALAYNYVETYQSKKSQSKHPVVLVGKGVMYDTGGLSLKPTQNSMDMMKCDMGGAAAVIGAIYSLALSKSDCYVVGLIPAVENRPGGAAYVPGDVITMMNGTTVEVLNTDAEGRLILADALHYAKRYNPKLVIDVATLTGAAARSIGKYGLVAMENYGKEIFTNFSDDMKNLLKSGNIVGERVAVQPFWDDYKKELELHDHPCLSSAPIFISLARNNSHGKQLTAQSVNLIVKRHARAAGVSQKITAHMFRHTCCTLAIEGGARPQQVQSHLRHKDIKTTMKYYEDRNQITDNASDYIQSV